MNANNATGHDIIVIGASAGGVEALVHLVRNLPRNLPAALFIVLHIPAHSPSLLPNILSRAGYLEAIQAEDKMKFEYGHIYLAPPDYHLLLEQGYVRVAYGPKENRHRPSVDPLFRSAARVYTSRVIGVILTGALDDGTSGLLAIKRYEGLAVVQDPNEALYPGMPQSALEHVNVDYCVPLAQMGDLLTRLVHEPNKGDLQAAISEDLEKEVRIAEMETNVLQEHEQLGKPSAFSCPECGGVLWELQDGNLLRFRCRTGHAFSPESVLAEQSEALERSLWFALKTMEEKVQLSRRIALRAQQHGNLSLAEGLRDQVQETEQQAATLRQFLTNMTNENEEATSS